MQKVMSSAKNRLGEVKLVYTDINKEYIITFTPTGGTNNEVAIFSTEDKIEAGREFLDICFEYSFM